MSKRDKRRRIKRREVRRRDAAARIEALVIARQRRKKEAERADSI